MKKFTVLFALFLLTSAGLSAQSAHGVTVSVTLENVQNDEGEILAGLHTAETFMKGMGIQNYKTEAREGALTFSFENVPPGEYAVSVLHDLNGNYQMDFETSGIPKEPYAMSGDQYKMGPPTFSGVRFTVAEQDLDLSLRF